MAREVVQAVRGDPGLVIRGACGSDGCALNGFLLASMTAHEVPCPAVMAAHAHHDGDAVEARASVARRDRGMAIMTYPASARPCGAGGAADRPSTHGPLHALRSGVGGMTGGPFASA